MIQFNLLPDVKLEYIKTRKTKRMVILSACGAGAVSLLLFVLLFTYVNIVQPQHLKSLNGSIKESEQKLSAVPDLNKVLTIQSQLSSLTNLHASDPATSRTFGYLSQVTPAKATISSATVDLNANTVTISGEADTLSTVNKFADTLKFTNYQIEGQNQSAPAFSNVVLGSFGKGDKTATYQLTFVFDPTIFDNTKDVKLVVPKIISTRSETEKPSDLFKQSQNNTGQGQ